MKDFSEEEKPYSVGAYLDLLNEALQEYEARIQGEVTELNIYPRFLFFSLKDKEDKSLLNCFMWGRDYRLCGIELEEGMEIIAQGYPDIYKPNGRLSLQTSIVELVGEGALKKAYEQLHKRLQVEGLFKEERKRALSDFPKNIGLITSSSGAVIHDFLNNLGKYGYKTKFLSSRVEGQAATAELLAAVEHFKNKGLDALVIIRGGGSLESLQAFNNEALVRAVATFDAPVICGIGHDKDVPLVSLAADLMVSTPTAAAMALNRSWDKLSGRLAVLERDLFNKYSAGLLDKRYLIEALAQRLQRSSDFAAKRFEELKVKLSNKSQVLERTLKKAKERLDHSCNSILVSWGKDLKHLGHQLDKIEKRLKGADPKRQLALGYSITSVNGVLIRSASQVKLGDRLDIRVADGHIASKVEGVGKNEDEVEHGEE